MANPFVYGAPVTGELFVGREAELRALGSRMRNHINVVVMGPRRFGKTSLLAQAVHTLPKHAVAVSVNLVQCATPARFAAEILRGAYRHSRRRRVEDFVRRLRVQPNVTVRGQDVGFTFAPSLAETQLEDAISDAYAALADLSTERRFVVLVLDEFQGITTYGNHLPMLLKGLADQYPAVSLIMAGSRQTTMEELTRVRGAPLLGMAEPIALGPIPTGVMTNYLVERAHRGRKALSLEVAEVICDLVGPAPNDVQRLAFEAFELAAEAIDAHVVEEAMALAVERQAANFTVRLERITAPQLHVLNTLAQCGGSEHPFGQEFVQAVGKGTSYVQKAVRGLEREELIVRRGGRLTVEDPFLAQWLTGPERAT